MDLFVGLDVALEETSLCIIDKDGKTVRETKVETEPEAIRSALESIADRLGRIGIEASSIGMWLHRELHALGFPVVVVEAHHAHVSLSAMRNKTDRNDARGIAQLMRLGWYRAVHVKSVETQKLRTLLSNRKLLKRKLVDLENHIRGALRTYGLRVGPVSRGEFEARIRELIEHADWVGVDDPHRFARSRTVGAHFGLTPRRHQSGTSIDFEGHISKRGDFGVREALCEAAASLLMRVKKWSALKAWGMKIAKRSSMMCAIVAVARKLAAILHRMWIDGTDFQWTAGARITPAMRLKLTR